MALHSQDHNNYISVMADGTVKQRNPFSGTNVWTVPGRGHRPLSSIADQPLPLDPADHGRHCAFCGEVLAQTCRGCGAPAVAGACCTHCGTPLVPPPALGNRDPETWADQRRRQIADWRALLD